MKIGEVLVARGLLSPEDLARQLARQKKQPHRRLGELLVEADLVSDAQLLSALAEQLGLPYLEGLEDVFSPRLAGLVPFELWQRWVALPLLRGERALVASADPLALPRDELESTLGRKVELAFAAPTEIAGVLERNYWKPERREARHDIGVVPGEAPGVSGGGQNLLDLANKAPVIRLVNQVIYQALQQKASDIHLQAREKDFRVRYRVDGVLHDAFSLPASMQPGVISRIKILSALNIAERRIPQDGRTAVQLDGRAVDIRVSILPTYWGEGAVLRLLDQTSFDFSLETLGLFPDERRLLKQMIVSDHGIILLTGPTGSGKTTTLYAVLQEINHPDRNIITLEDPVEYQIPGVSQIQVNPNIELTFAAGLRSILRHDPDILMVGEIRDRETAEMAVQSSLTGHLVFSTLHTNDAASTITRLMDMGVEPYLIASSVIGIIAQRLVRVICKHCRVEEKLPAGALQSAAGAERIFRGAGCEHCFQTGYRGRLGIFEFFPFDDRACQLIVERCTARQLKDHAVKKGMRTLRLSGEARVLEGVTTLDEVLRVTS